MDESFTARVQRGLLRRALREQGAFIYTRLRRVHVGMAHDDILEPLDDATAEHAVAVVKHGRLPGAQRPLRLVKSDLEHSVFRRYHRRCCGRGRVSNLHLRFDRLPADGIVEETEICDAAV